MTGLRYVRAMGWETGHSVGHMAADFNFPQPSADNAVSLATSFQGEGSPLCGLRPKSLLHVFSRALGL